MMLRLLLSRSAMIAVLVSSVLFGVSHSLNLASGQSLATTIAQVVFALIFGFSTAMMWLVGKSLWPLIAFHVVYDFTVLTGPTAGGSSPVFDAVNTLILLVGALVLVAWYRSTRGRPQQVAPATSPTSDDDAVGRLVG
jgi:membrane protease YdiL (CAAX protease family)